MIQLSSAGKRYGHKLLFEGVDWLITPKDRIGLVGANGTGKSTLLRVLGRLETLNYGSISIAKGISAGYLPQDGLTLSGRTVFAECMSVFSKLRAMEEEMEQLTASMSELDHASAEYAQVADRYQRVEHEFQTRDGYAIEAQVGSVLTGLGFRKDDWDRQTDEFSGGWQMRIALAKLLLQKPNLLLLDEPTNHLDLEARNWLEEYLTEYPYAFVLISHDRYFLDVTVGKIVEIWNKRIHFYAGNYDKYEEQKTQRREQLEAAYRNQRERIEQLEVFINRFRYQATKAKQVQSRIKELEKMDRIELPEEEKTIHFSFPQPKASGRIVGERNRYPLLRMLLHPANFPLLNESTKHLDMRAKDILLEALSKYTGTVVFVSHDRYFIDKLATRVFEIGDGRVEVYPGNYEDYRWRKGGGAARLQEAVAAAPAAVQPVNGNGAAPAESKSKRLNPIKRKQMEDRVRELEHEITRMEAAIAECESALQTFVSADETQRLTQELEKHKRSLQAKVQEWEELGQALEA